MSASLRESGLIPGKLRSCAQPGAHPLLLSDSMVSARLEPRQLTVPNPLIASIISPEIIEVEPVVGSLEDKPLKLPAVNLRAALRFSCTAFPVG